MSKLSPKMEEFCQQYLVDLCGTKAAVRAGYSKHTANRQAYDLLQRFDVKERIRELRDEIMETTGVTAAMVVQELSRVAFWNIQDFIDAGNTIRDLTTLDRQKAIPVVGIKTREKYEKDAEGKPVKVIETELKMADKLGALETLGRHLGIFEIDNKQQSAKIIVTRK